MQGKLKEEVEAVKGDGATQLDQERARHASAIQNAKVDPLVACCTNVFS